MIRLFFEVPSLNLYIDVVGANKGTVPKHLPCLFIRNACNERLDSVIV